MTTAVGGTVKGFCEALPLALLLVGAILLAAFLAAAPPMF